MQPLPVSPLLREISPIESHGTTQDIRCCRQNGGEVQRDGAAQAAAKSPAPHGLLQPGQQGLFPQWQAWPIFGRSSGSGSGDERWWCREEGAAAIYLFIHPSENNELFQEPI